MNTEGRISLGPTGRYPASYHFIGYGDCSRSGGCDGGMKKVILSLALARLVWGWPNLALWACSRSWR